MSGEEDSNFVVSVSLTSTHDTSVSFKYAFEDIADEAEKGVDYTEVAENQRIVTIRQELIEVLFRYQ